MQRREVQANGIRYAYLEEGSRSAPLVLLLHGYPDSANSWEHQLPALAAAGYRAVAPFMRGYPPTEVPARGFYDRATLALDVKGLVDALVGDDDDDTTSAATRPVYLVGQDWGAAISYGVLGAFGDRFKRAVILAVPHPVQIKRTLRRSPKHAFRSFHWFLFQLPRLPELLLRVRDHAFIEFLWWLWSPAYDDHAHVAEIKRMMSAPGVIEGTLSYYRSMFRSRYQDQAPEVRAVRDRLDNPIGVPTLVLCGSRDMRGQMLPGQGDLFRGTYEWAIVEGAGHFLHREKPAEVTRTIIEWLGREDETPRRPPGQSDLR